MSAGIEAVAILFFYIALGWIGSRTLINQELMPGLNRFVYYFAVPALLFQSARQISPEELWKPLPIGALMVGIVLTAMVTVVTSWSVFKTRQGDQLVIRQLLTTFSNYAYMGIPVVTAFVGDAGFLAMITIILITNLVLIGSAQILLQTFQRDRSQSLSVGRQIAGVVQQSLLKSPVFLSSVIGLLFSAGDLALPGVLEKGLNAIGSTTVPLALFCLGAALQFRQSGSSVLELITLIAFKLFLHPSLTVLAIVLLGVSDPIWITVLILMSALPTGALAHVVAQHHKVYANETSLVITVTTLLSLLTLPVWVQIAQAFVAP
ncbi:AEC family transporter [Parendozoicomonas haliclonae]|uniref:AEC family transporter n=1 Tax=Parendozoicomonas haliclonae TaxID=1960125 RepID=UPI0013FE1B9C|nr:AEC family transporter [Parendozoicomonas haliclonae]